MTILSDDPACRRPVRGLLLPTPEEVRSCLPRTGTEPVETVEMESAVDWNGGECLGCGLCARKCPAGIIRMEDKRPSIDHGKCIACGACVKACPRAALSLKGTGGKP